MFHIWKLSTAGAHSLSSSIKLCVLPRPKRKMSFIKVAENSDFSFHNLPYGVFSTPDNVSVILTYMYF